MEPLAKAFGNAHGLRLKTTFAETLVQILHPISKVHLVPFLLPNTLLISITDCSS
jgi:hypothetical protein